MEEDVKFMQRALQLARRGERKVAPNPMVGAVIVKNGRIIGEGWHKKFGGPHAEVNAIHSIRRPADLRGATLYVTLEPCRHWGKTPPCVNAIRTAGIRRLIAGSRDPSQKSNRIIFLKGPVAQACQELNKFFFTWVTQKRPYITVKIAISADGFIAGPQGKPVRITNKNQDQLVHRLRAQHQAIMVGVNTVITDDPLLNVRHVKGPDPLRVILDSRLCVPRKAKVLRGKNYLIATCVRRPLRGLNIWVSPTQKQVNLKKLFAHLAKQGISSVLVEPGPILFRSLQKTGLVDEWIFLIGKKKIRKGIPFIHVGSDKRGNLRTPVRRTPLRRGQGGIVCRS